MLLIRQKIDQLGDAKDKDCELTWLQTAVKVEDDHEEAAQTQGKNQPVHFRVSHAESWRGGGPGDRGTGVTEPNRTDSGWKQTAVLFTLSPTKASIRRADLCHVGACRTSLNARSAGEKSGIGSASRLAEHLREKPGQTAPPGRSHRRPLARLWSAAGKVPGTGGEALLLFNSFLPKHKF